METINEIELVDNVVDRLVGRFPQVERSHIESVVRDVATELDGATIRDFVPVLVERSAKDRIRQQLMGNPAA